MIQACIWHQSRQSSAVLKRASERLRKVMEAQPEGSAGAQQINATSTLDGHAALHTRSLPPPIPGQHSSAALPAPSSLGPGSAQLRRHNRTHSGHVPKSNAPSSSYAQPSYPWTPTSEAGVDLYPEASGASDTSNASFYTAAEDGAESSAPSFAERPPSGIPGGKRDGRADRPSPLGANAGAGHPPLPTILTGSRSSFSHHAQVCIRGPCPIMCQTDASWHHENRKYCQSTSRVQA